LRRRIDELGTAHAQAGKGVPSGLIEHPPIPPASAEVFFNPAKARSS
jgi:hypothetical protein